MKLASQFCGLCVTARNAKSSAKNHSCLATEADHATRATAIESIPSTNGQETPRWPDSSPARSELHSSATMPFLPQGDLRRSATHTVQKAQPMRQGPWAETFDTPGNRCGLSGTRRSALRRPVEPIFRRLVSAAADRPGHVLQLRIVPPDLEDLDPMAGGGPGRNRRRPVEASSAFSVQRFG